jgi:hypothetical protein
MGSYGKTGKVDKKPETTNALLYTGIRAKSSY